MKEEGQGCQSLAPGISHYSSQAGDLKTSNVGFYCCCCCCVYVVVVCVLLSLLCVCCYVCARGCFAVGVHVAHCGLYNI